VLYLFAPILVQVLLVIHIVRQSRNQLWLLPVIFLPVAGSIAYIVVEILPDLLGNRQVRAAEARAVETVNPKKALRAAEAQLEVADTAANRAQLAEALAGLALWPQAHEAYERALAAAPGTDSRLTFKAAGAAFEAGRFARARELLGELQPFSNARDEDERLYLEGRVAEALGEHEVALRLYAEVAARVPGDEVRCRWAALLLTLGRRGEARSVLREVHERAAILPKAILNQHRAMYRWADEQLAALDAG